MGAYNDRNLMGGCMSLGCGNRQSAAVMEVVPEQEGEPLSLPPMNRPTITRALTLPKRLASSPFQRMSSVPRQGRRSEGGTLVRRHGFLGTGDSNGLFPLASPSGLSQPIRQMLESALVSHGFPDGALIDHMTVWELSEGQAVLNSKEDGHTARLIVVEKGILSAQVGPNHIRHEELYTAGCAFVFSGSAGSFSPLRACTEARVWVLPDLDSYLATYRCRGVPDLISDLIPALYPAGFTKAGLPTSAALTESSKIDKSWPRNETYRNGQTPSLDITAPTNEAPATPSSTSTLTNSDLLSHKLDELERLAVLGCGAFAYVLLVRCQNRLYALKVLSKEHVLKKGLQAHVLRESRIMKGLNCPFLVNLISTAQDSQCLYMLLDFQQGGEFFGYLQSRSEPLSESEAMFYAACVIQGLDFLHQRGIAWRDLKPENLLLDSKGYLHLADFGFAKQFGKTTRRSYTICGTPEYLAPEILLRAGHDLTVDWWALGVLIYEMVTGSTPFPDEDRQVMFRAICDVRYTLPSFFSKELKDLIKRLLAKQPIRRLGARGATEIRRHPWFARFNWKAMSQQTMPAPYIPQIAGPEDLSHFPADQQVPDMLIGTNSGVSSGAFAEF